MKKKYRVLSSMDTRMQITNQRVMVFELGEVEFEDFNLPSGREIYTYNDEGEQYVIPYPSYIADQILQHSQQEEIVTIDSNYFNEREEFKNGRNVIIYYHESVDVF